MTPVDGAGPRASRRDAMALLVAMATGAALPAAATATAKATALRPAPSARATPALALVSRHLQWTSAQHGIAIARAAGFPAILWTVRRGAHFDPAQVRTELPRLVALSHDAGLATPMIITAIGDPGSEGTEAILATMQQLGLTLYRAAAPRYRYDAPIAPQLAAFGRALAVLATLNARYGTTAAFHTHSYADTIGGGAWDLWTAMRALDPARVGLNYDIGHVTAKGGAGWRESVRAVGPYLHSCSIKDFVWEKETAVPAGQWPWRTRFVRPGEGMVDFDGFFRYLQSIDFAGPLETYFEYSIAVPGRSRPFDMLGTDYGVWKLDMPEPMFIDLLKRDVAFYADAWRRAFMTPPAPPYSVKAEEMIA